MRIMMLALVAIALTGCVTQKAPPEDAASAKAAAVTVPAQPKHCATIFGAVSTVCM
jgi:PBP1b-binding outer membrane lipoprotein LpoB